MPFNLRNVRWETIAMWLIWCGGHAKEMHWWQLITSSGKSSTSLTCFVTSCCFIEILVVNQILCNVFRSLQCHNQHKICSCFKLGSTSPAGRHTFQPLQGCSSTLSGQLLTFALSDLCFHALSLPCSHTFCRAIPTSFYIFNAFKSCLCFFFSA